MLKSRKFVFNCSRLLLIVVENSRHAQAEITSLREELKEAKEARSQKVQYDEFTRAMLKKTPKSRAEQITYILLLLGLNVILMSFRTIEKLTVELEELESELSSYSTVWDARKSTFDSILNNLDVLRREVEDEKEQQDRKEGMNEGSEHEEEEGQATGAQTPAIKESEEERHVREGSRDSGEVDEDAREDAAFPEEEMKDEDTKEELMSTFPSTFPSRIPTEANTPRGKNGELDTEDGDETDEVRMVETELKMDVD